MPRAVSTLDKDADTYAGAAAAAIPAGTAANTIAAANAIATHAAGNADARRPIAANTEPTAPAVRLNHGRARRRPCAGRRLRAGRTRADLRNPSE